jgi:phenylacetate-CoA ligase
MNIRSFSFFALDAIRGSRLKSHLSNLRQELGAAGHDQQAQASKLESLLQHSAVTTAFYRQHGSRDISDFPVIDKNTIKSQPDAFLSGKFSKQQLHRMVTSGSTGTPFVTYQDQNKKLRNAADTIYFAGLAGFQLGESLYYFKIWSDLNKKSRLMQWQQHIYPLDVLHLNDEMIADWVKAIQENKSPKHILGYSSALEKIARYVERKDLALQASGVHSIISMSEALNDYTKSTLAQRFGVMPCSRYSNIENGIIAQQTPDSGTTFLVNTASYWVEILDLERDMPVKPGELGRIVVTDLYNYAMPLIRYDTGDLGAMPLLSDGQVDCTRLSHIEGRKLDVLFDTRGEIISSYLIYKNMWKYPEIDQYQLIQEDVKRYRFKINAPQSFSREQELKAEFLGYLGKDAIFEIEYVDEIPLLDSGKRRKVVNNYWKQ